MVAGAWSTGLTRTDADSFSRYRTPPDLRDPRGLTEQERQVVTYVPLGETNKLIAYRIGLSPGRVSILLKSAIHKLGVNTRTQLVRKLGPLGVSTPAHDAESVS